MGRKQDVFEEFIINKINLETYQDLMNVLESLSQSDF
jgi:hypothetical protein